MAGHWDHGVDILVNNVGVVDRQNVLELPEAEWDRVIGVSLKSVQHVSCARSTRRCGWWSRGGAGGS